MTTTRKSFTPLRALERFDFPAYLDEKYRIDRGNTWAEIERTESGFRISVWAIKSVSYVGTPGIPFRTEDFLELIRRNPVLQDYQFGVNGRAKHALILILDGKTPNAFIAPLNMLKVISEIPKTKVAGEIRRLASQPSEYPIEQGGFNIAGTEMSSASSSNESANPDEDRLKFMKEIYQIYQESGPNVIVNMWKIGGKIGFERTATDKAATWLADHGYLRWMTAGGGLSITTKGIDFWERTQLSKSEMSKTPATKPTSNYIFIVHGHDAASKEELARILEKLGLSPVILHEQPEKGRVLIEKLEQHTSDVGYAFVLLTPDDVGSQKDAKPEELKPRARQNVIFEFGYLMGKLGRNRICCLYTGSVEQPTDLEGIVYVPFRDSVHEAYEKIVRELRAAGYQLSL